MSLEIERKFLVEGDGWRSVAGEGLACRQGYLCADESKAVRVRLLGDCGYLTIKGATNGISRLEFDYEIPATDASELLALCDAVIEKVRYEVLHAGLVWEVDLFEGANQGLVMAEVELESEEQLVDLPDWAGQEVSDDPRYYNAYLAHHPFTSW